MCVGGKEISLKTSGPKTSGSSEVWGKEPEKASEKARDQENRRKTSSKYRKTRERSILRKREGSIVSNVVNSSERWELRIDHQVSNTAFNQSGFTS